MIIPFPSRVLQTLKTGPIYKFLLIASLSVNHSVIHAQPTLVFNTTGQPPLNTKNHDGFMDEVTREALKRISYNLVINRLPAERGLHNANNGLIDGEMSRVKGIEKTYPNLVRIPEKIMNWDFVVFSQQAIDLQSGWSSLNGKNVSFITGWKILENNVPATAIVTKTKNSQQMFALLQKKRVDLIIYERWGGLLFIDNMKLDNVTLRHPALATRQMFIYLHKKHLNLVSPLSQALTAMKQDGSYNKLSLKYLSIPQKNK